MIQTVERSQETNNHLDFQQRIAAVTDRQLSAETIDSYADDALMDLVEVVEDATTQYESHFSFRHETRLEAERAALTHAGLEPEAVETTLDHIADIADQIKTLDTVIKTRTTRLSGVIVPASSARSEISVGDGTFAEKMIVPRLKTVLFVLANDCGVDVHDPEQLRITEGALKNDMMRGQSYNLVEAPSIERTVLVCDEEGNATYIFKNEILRQYQIEPTEIASLTKDDLNELLTEQPELGLRMKYTNQFVPRLIAALRSEEYEETSGRYFQARNRAPEGYVSRSGFAKQLGIDVGVIQRVVDTLDEELGDALVCSFKYGAPTKAYSPYQQEMIRSYLEKEGTLNQLPEGYLSVFGISKMTGVDRGAINRVIKTIGDQLGEVLIARSKGEAASRLTQQYSLDQQEMIMNFLERDGYFTDLPEEGYLPIKGIADLLGVQFETVKRTIKQLEGIVGEPVRSKGQAGRGATEQYSLDQQEMIRQALEARGVFSAAPPEGYISVMGMARMFGGVEGEVVRRAIHELGGDLGEAITAKPEKGPPATYYSPDQTKMVYQWLVRNGRKRASSKLVRNLDL